MRYIIFLFSFLVFSQQTNAALCTTPSADLCQLNVGAGASINKFSVCKAIVNGSAKSIMIPSLTSAEWAAFVAHPPASVTLANCAAPTYVTSISAYSQTVGKPSGLAVGDLMIVSVYANYNITATMTLSGFTYIDSPYATTGGYYSARFYKIATAADVAGSGYTFSSSSLSSTMMAVIRGVDTVNPIQDHTRNTNTGTTLTYTAATTTQANSMIFLTAEAASAVAGTPAGYTLNWSNGGDATGFYTTIQASAGTTGSPTASISPSQWWSASLVIINPL